MLKPLYYHYEQCSDLLSNPRVGSSTPTTDKFKKLKFLKLEKIEIYKFACF